MDSIIVTLVAVLGAGAIGGFTETSKIVLTDAYHGFSTKSDEVQ